MSDIDQEIENAGRELETEILNEAFSDDPPQEDTQQPETAEAEAEKTSQERDPETGRFKAKETEQVTEKVETPDEKGRVETGKDDEHGQVPSWRVREINEEKRAAQARAEAAERASSELKSRLDMLERQLQQPRQPQQEQPKQERPDPILDPDGYDKWVMDRVEARQREANLNLSMALAHNKHGETFEKAYNALIAEGQAGNRQLVNQLTSQPNPGEAVVKWFRNQETLREVGDDPAAYKSRILDEAMKDPAFQAKVIELVKGATPNAQRPNNVTQLPPSLSRATGSKSAASIEDDTDGSDRAVFDYAFR